MLIYANWVNKYGELERKSQFHNNEMRNVRCAYLLIIFLTLCIWKAFEKYFQVQHIFLFIFYSTRHGNCQLSVSHFFRSALQITIIKWPSTVAVQSNRMNGCAWEKIINRQTYKLHNNAVCIQFIVLWIPTQILFFI